MKSRWRGWIASYPAATEALSALLGIEPKWATIRPASAPHGVESDVRELFRRYPATAEALAVLVRGTD